MNHITFHSITQVNTELLSDVLNCDIAAFAGNYVDVILLQVSFI